MLKKILVEASARHIHLTKEAINLLFGQGYVLSVKKNLSQPGQYLSYEKVSIVGPKGSLNTVSVLGPERENIQVELSKTDLRTIGVVAPIRESGDIEQSGGCRVVGPKGEIEITKGVIVAKRHIHANFEEAKALEIKDKDIVWVRINSKDRALIFGDVVVRVSDKFSLAMHIDTDEANACNLEGQEAEIVYV